jgi:hypothetical protein
MVKLISRPVTSWIFYDFKNLMTLPISDRFQRDVSKVSLVSKRVLLRMARTRLCNALSDYSETLVDEFSKADLDLDMFYEKYFKKNRLSEYFLPFYVDYYANIETNKATEVGEENTEGSCS